MLLFVNTRRIVFYFANFTDCMHTCGYGAVLFWMNATALQEVSQVTE